MPLFSIIFHLVFDIHQEFDSWVEKLSPRGFSSYWVNKKFITALYLASIALHKWQSDTFALPSNVLELQKTHQHLVKMVVKARGPHPLILKSYLHHFYENWPNNHNVLILLSSLLHDPKNCSAFWVIHGYLMPTKENLLLGEEIWAAV